MKYILCVIILFVIFCCESDPDSIRYNGISEYGVEVVELDHATIKFNLPENNVYKAGVIYSMNRELNVEEKIIYVDNVQEKEQTVLLDNLKEDTEYFFRVFIEDKLSNKIFSELRSFSTKKNSIEVSISEIQAAFKSSDYQFQLKSHGLSWEIACDQSWCEITPTKGTQDTTVIIHVKEYDINKIRIAKISIRFRDKQSLIIPVIQEAAPYPTIQLSSIACKIDAQGADNCSFCIETNENWSVSSNQDWCKVKTNQGVGNGIIYYSVDESKNQYSCRMATISVTTNTDKQDFIVLQDYYDNPIKYAYTPSSTCEVHYSANSFGNRISLITPTKWTVSTDSEWVTFSNIEGENSDILEYDYVAQMLNPSVRDRIAIINIVSGLYSSNIIHVFCNVNSIEEVPLIEMIEVKGGEFVMGNNNNSQTSPEHRVYLDDFHISKYEITQDIWLSINSCLPSIHTSRGNLQPAVGSWDTINEFISRLNKKTGLKYRLPTEAEWEYAAKGGYLSKGYAYSGSNIFNDVGWLISDYQTSIYKGAKKANELGIYDMSGNVGEFCSDWYSEYSKEYQTNPTGPKEGTFKVVRGMGTSTNTDRCYVEPDVWMYNWSYKIGFRLVLDN